MGYTTRFEGHFILLKCLTVKQKHEIDEFTSKDHRNEDYCPDGQYYCLWGVTEDGEGVCWDGGEKFSKYTEWLRILIEKFFKPWGIRVAGRVRYIGEDWDDTGFIIVGPDEQTVEKRQMGYVPKDTLTAIDEAIKAVEAEEKEKALGILQGILKSLKQ